MSTRTGDSAKEARLLRGLLDDAHQRIRELQSRLDHFSDDLLTLKLNDRRHSNEPHGQLKHERRHDRARVTVPEEEYPGQGRSAASSTWIK
jgi:hypothetical protein